MLAEAVANVDAVKALFSLSPQLEMAPAAFFQVPARNLPEKGIRDMIGIVGGYASHGAPFSFTLSSWLLHSLAWLSPASLSPASCTSCVKMASRQEQLGGDGFFFKPNNPRATKVIASVHVRLIF